MKLERSPAGCLSAVRATVQGAGTRGCSPLVAALLALLAAVPAGAAAESEDAADAAVSRRLRLERETRDSAWVITPMRPSYILPATYLSNVNKEPWRATGDDTEFDAIEVKFQFSFKLAVWEEPLGPNSDLYFGYTQVSVWQAYNDAESSPFRDTNYEPEFFVSFDTDVDVLGLKNRAVSLGVVHQSNGRGSEDLSRSWNRAYANFILERGPLGLSIKPWYRFPEDRDDDNNPNIERYYGYGEVRAAYKYREQVFAAMGRNNLRADGNKGALELSWSFPLGRVRGLVQYFAGYGETLLDYNHSQQRIGVGVMLSDWL